MDLLIILIALLVVTLAIIVIVYFIVLNNRQSSSTAKSNQQKAKAGAKGAPKAGSTAPDMLPKAGSLQVASGAPINSSKIPSRMATEEFQPGAESKKSTIPDPV